MAVAARLQSPALVESVGAAYVHAMGVVLVAAAILALLGAVAAGAFLPARGTSSPADRSAERIPA
jgi:hypothetical protein